jgi:4-amino-4-deoxy-L-arabinose transferase-like glycosyltransferase
MRRPYLHYTDCLLSWLKARPEYLILALFSLLYLPLVHQPLLRTTGDEKVYVAQAWEMAARGSWFVQTLADIPNYYKPPLHYILLRLGFLTFGSSLWAGLWMNAVALGFASFWLCRSIRNIFGNLELAQFCGLGLILAPTVFAHFFASQMEIELLALYTLSLVALLHWEQRPHARSWFGLWLLAGLAAWLKSPVHSVLLALGLASLGLSSWSTCRRQLWFWMAPLCGVLLGSLSILIPLVIDTEAFYRTYIVRETFAKGANGIRVWQSVLPNLSYHIWPIAPHLLLGAAAVLMLKPRFQLLQSPGFKPALALAIPTFAFFAWHPYRSEIYALPAIPGVILLAGLLWQSAAGSWPVLARLMHGISLLSSLLLPGLLLLLRLRFPSIADWWPSGLTLLCIAVFVLQLIMLVRLLIAKELRPARDLMLCWGLALWTIGLAMAAIGKEDRRGLQELVRTQAPPKLGFYNLQHFVWSEWALLNLTSGIPIKGLHEAFSLQQWMLDGGSVIVSDDKELEQVQGILGTDVSLKRSCWRRWQSHGTHDPQRNPMLAWQRRDLELLRGCAYVLTL